MSLPSQTVLLLNWLKHESGLPGEFGADNNGISYKPPPISPGAPFGSITKEKLMELVETVDELVLKHDLEYTLTAIGNTLTIFFTLDVGATYNRKKEDLIAFLEGDL